MNVEHISDTAHWMAYVRAIESERPDALFRDPFARQLAGHFGEAVARDLGGIQGVANSIAIRTAVLDGLLTDMVHRLDVDLVVSIGSGLDTRPWRLTLPRRLQWLDVDLPKLLDHKSQILAGHPPNCRYEALGADILHQGQRANLIGAYPEARRMLVLTEGLLIYLRPEQVRALAGDLHQHRACQWWLTDLIGPRALEATRNAWANRLHGADFHFAPADSTAFFAELGWQEHSFHSAHEEARRLGRALPTPWLSRLYLMLSSPSVREEFRRLAGIAVLARDET